MNAKSLRDNANSFKKASERCFEPRNLPDGKYQMLIVPSIVNLAFSAELFIKFILLSKNKKIKGHKLIDLYNSLDDSTKIEIVNLTHLNRNIFEQFLDECSETFIEWRYIHEKDSGKINVDFMQKLVLALDIYAKEIEIQL